MSLSDLSIERPVLTWMLTLALATFGILGLGRLGIDRYPDMTMPFVGVVVTMESASPTPPENLALCTSSSFAFSVTKATASTTSTSMATVPSNLWSAIRVVMSSRYVVGSTLGGNTFRTVFAF